MPNWVHQSMYDQLTDAKWESVLKHGTPHWEEE